MALPALISPRYLLSFDTICSKSLPFLPPRSSSPFSAPQHPLHLWTAFLNSSLERNGKSLKQAHWIATWEVLSSQELTVKLRSKMLGKFWKIDTGQGARDLEELVLDWSIQLERDKWLLGMSKGQEGRDRQEAR